MSFGGFRGQLVALFWSGVVCVAGCGHTLPTPPTGPHLHEEPTEVPYPPPAARVDLVQLPPTEMKHPVWIDGQWMWRGRRWVWEGGQWADLGPTQYYARPTLSWLSDGRLVWFPGSVRLASPSDNQSAPAAPSSSAIPTSTTTTSPAPATSASSAPVPISPAR